MKKHVAAIMWLWLLPATRGEYLGQWSLLLCLCVSVEKLPWGGVYNCHTWLTVHSAHIDIFRSLKLCRVNTCNES